MDITKDLKTVIQSIDECVAIGVVDISNGNLLAVDTTASHPSKVLQLVAMATADLFAGKTILEIENIFKESRNTKKQRHYFQEIIVNSDNLIHFFLRDQNNQNKIGVFVCKNKVLLGMALNQARQAMSLLAHY